MSIIMKCAQCGADMIAPEWSEHVSDRRVRNFWSCEACAINVVRLALEAEEDNRAQSRTARIALDHLEDMATELKTKWHEDYASLREPS